MRNLERFRQSSILSKKPSALFPPKHSIIPSTAHHFPQFLCTCILQAHTLFCFALIAFWWRICRGAWVAVNHGTYSYWMIQSFRVLWIITVVTPIIDTSGVQINIKKNFLLVLSSVENLTKGKTKGILFGKLIFSPTTCVIVILQRLEAFTCKNCSFKL